MSTPSPIGAYLVDMAQLPIRREVHDRSIDTQQPPASNAAKVSRLALDGAHPEIEAIAILPE